MIGTLANAQWEPLAWVLLGFVAALGLLALVSPRRFATVATRGSQWVDSEKVLASLDKRVDIDHYVLPFSRWLGLAVLASVVAIAWLLAAM